MPKRLLETIPLTEATLSAISKDGRMPVQAISAGKGSSGTYPAAVLEQAATDKLIDAGTPLFFDHPSESDRIDRPERSVRDIAAVFTGPATYDATREALVGEIQVFGPYRELVAEMAPYIGLSIHGSATDIVEGVVEGLAAIDSVDLVTKAGRGGMFLLESARPSKVNARARAHGVAEATVNDTREALQTVLRDAYGTERVGQTAATYVWVRDFDDTTVWFEVDGPGEDSGLYAQPYSQADNGAVALSGTRTEVRVQTTYVPVTRPDSTTPTTEADQEVTMGNIQVDEAVHNRAVEQAGRVPTLESERDTAISERDEARAQLAARDREARARVIVGERATEAKVAFDDLQVAGLVANLPVKEGALDEEAFTTTVDAAAKRIAEAAAGAYAGASGPTGFGASASGTGVTESGRRTTTPWGRPLTAVTESKGA